MKKAFILFLLCFISFVNIFSQGSYMFFTLRGGLAHNINIQPPVRYRAFNLVVTDPKTKEFVNKDFRLLGGEVITNYTSGYYVNINFHYDLENDFMGFFTGIEYNKYGYQANYKNKTGDSTLIEYNYINSIGIPFVLKLGTDMYNLQNYFYTGFQVNYNMKLTRNIKPSFTTSIDYSDNKTQFYNQTTLCIFIGYNYFIWNIEAQYIPTNFTKEISDNRGLPDRMFLIKTGVNIPISSWTTQKIKDFKKEVKRNKSKRF